MMSAEHHKWQIDGEPLSVTVCSDGALIIAVDGYEGHAFEVLEADKAKSLVSFLRAHVQNEES